jgi:hypothetical protein
VTFGLEYLENFGDLEKPGLALQDRAYDRTFLAAGAVVC